MSPAHIPVAGSLCSRSGMSGFGAPRPGPRIPIFCQGLFGFGFPAGGGLFQRGRGVAGRERHDMEPFRLQRGEKVGQHVRRLLLGVVEQDDPAAGAAQPAHQQVELLLRRHDVPVRSPEIGAEHRHVLLVAARPAEQANRRSPESGKTWRLAARRLFHRRHAGVDIGHGLARAAGWAGSGGCRNGCRPCRRRRSRGAPVPAWRRRCGRSGRRSP